jgi:hypothetical protein
VTPRRAADIIGFVSPFEQAGKRATRRFDPSAADRIVAERTNDMMSSICRISIPFVFLALASISLCHAASGETSVFGAGVTAQDTVPILELLSKPDDYVGKTVRVRGTIADVCPRRGCWIDISDEDRTVQFKVEDGVIVFPTDIKGKSVLAEGVFARIELTKEKALAWAKHVAEEKGESFDPETAEVPTTIYRIDGKGAVVQ